jgi:predicted PurR-regulated permease PerM
VLIVLSILGGLVGVGALAAARISEQLRELRNQLPEAVRQVERWVEQRQGVVSLLQQSDGDTARQTEPRGERPPPAYRRDSRTRSAQS